MQRIDQRRSARRLSRRDFVRAAAAASALLPMPAIAQGAAGRVVVVGGGFAGASAARALKKLDPRVTVTLVEASETFTACRNVGAAAHDPLIHLADFQSVIFATLCALPISIIIARIN